jgi:hypothetical protein
MITGLSLDILLFYYNTDYASVLWTGSKPVFCDSNVLIYLNHIPPDYLFEDPEKTTISKLQWFVHIQDIWITEYRFT